MIYLIITMGFKQPSLKQVIAGLAQTGIILLLQASLLTVQTQEKKSFFLDQFQTESFFNQVALPLPTEASTTNKITLLTEISTTNAIIFSEELPLFTISQLKTN